jgi:hypothetical protein
MKLRALHVKVYTINFWISFEELELDASRHHYYHYHEKWYNTAAAVGRTAEALIISAART